MIYKKTNNYKTRKAYDKYVLDKSEKIEFSFFFTAKGNGLELEWQRKEYYYNEFGEIKYIHCDFYYENETREIKVAIECDDSSHNTRSFEDDIRNKFLERKGIHVMRFPAKKIIWNCLECVNEVKDYIEKRKKQLQQDALERRNKIDNKKDRMGVLLTIEEEVKDIFIKKEVQKRELIKR